jgi:hypothetical protein
MLGGGPAAEYVPASAMSSFGYSEKQIDPTHYEVYGVGTESTSPAWTEKIATARAAQIGSDERLRYFKVQSVRFGARCADKRDLYKGGKLTDGNYPQVTLDVVYAKGPVAPDATYAASKDTYERLTAEIAKGPPPGEDIGAIQAANRAQCRGSPPG